MRDGADLMKYCAKFDADAQKLDGHGASVGVVPPGGFALPHTGLVRGTRGQADPAVQNSVRGY
ncbi:hypothetical protein SAMN04488238_10812 [Roseicitreum antarcticum]|uniref:Uncharacterized protein n=1 Tax=Roseicitreum antarcticum TaxID=564137 RepID=A0A1H3BD40_9RHOB|nr:hypothetical protein SAMN04488238_10812 [Roseicitreum antarcticum]